VVLPPSLTEGMERFVPDLEKVLIRGSGHWTQQEKPDETSRAMIDWLNRLFH
jgi:non-specific protein-tyrosine kinase